MGKATVVPILVAMAAFSAIRPASAETTSIQRKCPVGEESVLVEIREIPDLNQRCYEVIYETQRGYVCVWAGGTPDGPYSYTMNFDPKKVTPQGWTGGGNVGCKAEDCFRGVCGQVIRKHREEQDRLKFDPDTAADQLEQFFKSGPPS